MCCDNTGEILVNPHDAECFARRRGKRRYKEWPIRFGDDVYALGTAVVNPETHEDLMLVNDEDANVEFLDPIASCYRDAARCPAKKRPSGERPG